MELKNPQSFMASATFSNLHNKLSRKIYNVFYFCVFTGNADNRQGCTQSLKERCTTDGQCKEDEVCRLSQGKKSCIPACTALNCGPGGICAARNHVAKCTCPPGKNLLHIVFKYDELASHF